MFKIREGVEWIKGPLSDLNLPGFLAYGAYVAEVLAPVPLILGVKARAAALVIAFQMFMAVVLVLRNDVFAIKQAGGGWAIELEALLFLTSLTLVFTGGGKYALSRQGRWD